MKKVFELLNKAGPLKGDIGLEIEAEGKNMRIVDNAFWKTEDDGSLRGHYPDSRAEFVLNKPILIKDVRKAVNTLVAALEGAELNFSFRTSVHVHVNVQDLTEAEVMNFMYIYLLLEEPLVNFCGRERKGNRFCMRIVDAEGIVECLNKIFEKGIKHAFLYDQNAVRYSGMNFAALKKYGSVEFRNMRGNMDEEVIGVWAETLHRLKEYSKNFKAPKEVHDLFVKQGPRNFMMQVLGEYYDNFAYPRMVKEMQRSYSLTLDLPYSYKEPKEVKEEDANVKFLLYCKEKVGAHVTNAKIHDQCIYVQLNYKEEWHFWRPAKAEEQELFEGKEVAKVVRPKAPRKAIIGE